MGVHSQQLTKLDLVTFNTSVTPEKLLGCCENPEAKTEKELRLVNTRISS